jgi:hypothetical protein
MALLKETRNIADFFSVMMKDIHPKRMRCYAEMVQMPFLT